MTEHSGKEHFRDKQRRVSPVEIGISNFASQWFLVPQGTGIVAVVLCQLHHQFNGLRTISIIIWVLNIVFLLLVLSIYLVRVVRYPRLVHTAFSTRIMESAGLASVSVAFTPIIQMLALTVAAGRNSHWSLVLYVLWWVNVVLAAMSMLVLPYIFVKMASPGLNSVPPAILLPVIAALTAAAGGGVICQSGGLTGEQQFNVVIVSYLLIGTGLPFSIACDGVFLTRMLNKAYPTGHEVYQLAILIGPLSQGSFALQILGQDVQRGALAAHGPGSFLTESAIVTIGASSQWLGLLSWSYAVFWWFFAIMGTVHFIAAAPREVWRWDSSLASWSMVFPMVRLDL